MGVTIEIPSLMATYNGMLFKSSLVGTFTQMGASYPLTLKRGELERARPQTPVPPYPYPTENVQVQNGDVTLGGTLSMPEGVSGKTDVPVVVMVTGSGSQDRDETIMDHKPFAVIADYLARNGIASLRCDDRGVGESGGDPATSTTEDYASDAEACISYLRDRGFSKVGVLGHSEGGTIAFLLSSKGKSDFAVSLCGMADRGDSTLYRQTVHTLEKSGVSFSDADTYAKGVVSAQRQKGTAWMRYFLDLDPSTFLGGISVPLLAVYADMDAQVIARYNAPKVQKMVSSATVKVYPGLNHLLQHCSTGLPTEYAQIEETISPEVLSCISEWILSLGK